MSDEISRGGYEPRPAAGGGGGGDITGATITATVGFVGDGTTIECTPTQMRTFPKDLVDELMRQGADVVADQIAENCEACGHEMSEHGPGGCAVRMDSAWTADNTKPCGCTQTVKS